MMGIMSGMNYNGYNRYSGTNMGRNPWNSVSRTRPEDGDSKPITSDVVKEESRANKSANDNYENSLFKPIERENAAAESDFPMMRKGADPAEMIIRGKIEYVTPEEARESILAEQKNAKEENTMTPQETAKDAECQTCKNRKYQDGSDDPGVSYKTPTKISADKAASAVMGHEMEHVNREQAKAEKEDREVVSQNVVIHTAICPECGEAYVSGGTTTTVTASAPEKPDIQTDKNAESVASI